MVVLDHDVVAVNVVDQIDHSVIDHHKNPLGVVLDKPLVRNGGVGQPTILHLDQGQTNVGTKRLLYGCGLGWVESFFQVQINFTR